MKTHNLTTEPLHPLRILRYFSTVNLWCFFCTSDLPLPAFDQGLDTSGSCMKYVLFSNSSQFLNKLSLAIVATFFVFILNFNKLHSSK